MRVRELMSQPAYSCSVHDPATTAAQIMWEHDCGVVPVTGDNGTVVGVVTDRDLCMAAYLQGAPLKDIPVSAAMSHELYACDPEDSVAQAEQVMSDRQVHRLPVVDGQRMLVGMLSLSDVARRLRNSTSPRIQEGREFVETVAAIVRPRTMSQQ